VPIVLTNHRCQRRSQNSSSEAPYNRLLPGALDLHQSYSKVSASDVSLEGGGWLAHFRAIRKAPDPALDPAEIRFASCFHFTELRSRKNYCSVLARKGEATGSACSLIDLSPHNRTIRLGDRSRSVEHSKPKFHSLKFRTKVRLFIEKLKAPSVAVKMKCDFQPLTICIHICPSE
jgi:hypothetical protein